MSYIENERSRNTVAVNLTLTVRAPPSQRARPPLGPPAPGAAAGHAAPRQGAREETRASQGAVPSLGGVVSGGKQAAGQSGTHRRYVKAIGFEPVFECDNTKTAARCNARCGRGGCDCDVSYVLTQDGVRFNPKIDVIQSLVSTWLEECSDSYAEGRAGGPPSMECECSVVAMVRGAGFCNKVIYKKSVRLSYQRDAGCRNKKAVAKLSSEVARVKNLCLNMLPSLPGMSPPTA